MIIELWVNGRKVRKESEPDILLLEFLRELGLKSVKRGCETSNCGICTVLMEGIPVLSCSVLAARAAGKHITTLEGIEEEARELGEFLADEGAEQCGYCSPGLVMNVIAMSRELQDPTDEEIMEYLAGNLCRCSGYMGQMRAIRGYMERGAANERG